MRHSGHRRCLGAGAGRLERTASLSALSFETISYRAVAWQLAGEERNQIRAVWTDCFKQFQNHPVKKFNSSALYFHFSVARSLLRATFAIFVCQDPLKQKENRPILDLGKPFD